MSDLVIRDVEYRHDGTRMLGYLCAPTDASAAPAVLLIHDAFGISDEMTDRAHQLARLGHPVFIADVWGERTLPRSEAEIGPLMGGMIGDRPQWQARIAAAHEAATTQPELAGQPLVLLGYCFGGSSALEHLRLGAEVAGVAAIHPGLDLLEHDWSHPGSGRVIVCVGADDPMATAEQRATVEAALSGAGIDWQIHLYSGTTHAFTSPNAQHSPKPEVFAYNPRSAARAWDATVRFLGEIADSQPLH